MTATTPQAQPVCRVICLGGRGKNESKYLQGRLPAEVALFLSDDHDLVTNARLEGPLLWRVNETTYPDSRQAQSEQFQRRLEGKQTSPSELGFLDERLTELLEGLDVVFLVVGLGGSSAILST